MDGDNNKQTNKQTTNNKQTNKMVKLELECKECKMVRPVACFRPICMGVVCNSCKANPIPDDLKKYLQTAKAEFETFANQCEELYEKHMWNGGWEQPRAVFIICAEYSASPSDQVHCNYEAGLSPIFDAWLEKYGFSFEWQTRAVGYIWYKYR